ncbi:hypothetical protein [Streptomyces cinereospinus]|uniref:Uncharacterized protein n=1 Tax=Streptomyces cinereospinus TaxID=285561 RepID=A0ABV5N3P8_9ACTN
MTTAPHSAAVARALVDIEDAKQSADPSVGECLDAVGDLIKEAGDPDAVFDWLLQIIARERCEARA